MGRNGHCFRRLVPRTKSRCCGAGRPMSRKPRSLQATQVLQIRSGASHEQSRQGSQDGTAAHGGRGRNRRRSVEAMSLKDKVALVTGCGSSGPGWGNGKAAAVLLAREGASVFGCDIKAQAAEETRTLVAQEGRQCEVMAVDVADDLQVKTMIDRCVDHFGRIDVLVNNVGIVEVGGPVE